MSGELRKAPLGTNPSITICKRCYFQNYDPLGTLSRCEWCGDDPHAIRPHLCLADPELVEAGTDDVWLQVQTRRGVDLHRYPERIREHVMAKGPLVAHWDRGPLRNYMRIIILLGLKWDGTKFVLDVFDCDEQCRDKNEAEFLELYEPLCFDAFWRESEAAPRRKRSPDGNGGWHTDKLVDVTDLAGGPLTEEMIREAAEEGAKCGLRPTVYPMSQLEADRLKRYGDQIGKATDEVFKNAERSAEQ